MTDIDPIIEQAIAALAQRDEISPALATIGLVNYAVTRMVNCAGADNTRDWCTAVIDSATHNQEAA